MRAFFPYLLDIVPKDIVVIFGVDGYRHYQQKPIIGND